MSSALGLAPLRLSVGVAIAGLCLSVACGGGDPAPGGASPSSSSSGSSSGGLSSGGGSSSGSAGSGSPADDSGAGNEDSGTPASPGPDSGSTATGEDGGTGGGAGLNPNVAPGGNFDLSIWQLQEPVGSPGDPTTFSPSQLEGATGHQDQYFYTDTTDGSMVFWDPENGVTTPNSNYPRSELREMTASGAAANWAPTGTNTLSGTLKATVVPDHVVVGQIHLGTGTPSSTKPLLELYYYSTGDITIGIEQTPAGGNEIETPVGSVPLGTVWSYVIGLSGNMISIAINDTAATTFTMSSTFDQEGMYFKAGNYDQSVGTDPNVASQVQFYALSVAHSQ
jgi:hypothetical protein